MWYYSFNGQSTGPVQADVLLGLLNSGTITAKTLVWTEGMSAWQELGNTVLSTSMPPSAQPVGVAYQPAGTPGYFPVLQSTNFHYAPGSASALKNAYISWLVVYSVTLIASRLTGFLGKVNLVIIANYIVSFVSFIGAILLLIMLYRSWKVVQDGYASTTPRQAIGFLFVPLFNFYWLFKAFAGLSVDLNSFIDRHFGQNPEIKVRKAVPAFTLIYCIFLLIAQGYNVFYYSMMSSGNFFYSANPRLYSIVMAIFSLLHAAVNITAITDLYLTSKSILNKIVQPENLKA
jgi:hypothetical protein